MALHSPAGDLTAVSVCAGGGGLDLGLDLAFHRLRTVLYVEREARAVATLAAAIEAGYLAPAPIWSDARTVPGRRFRGCVDLIFGGIPCQPHSLAGKRLGRADERDLWGAFRRLIVQTGAWACLLENVGGMLSSKGGAERVYTDLSRLGFSVEGGLFRATEVRGTHRRERLFILAVREPGPAEPGALANRHAPGSSQPLREPGDPREEQAAPERIRGGLGNAERGGYGRRAQDPLRLPQGRAAIAWTGYGAAFPPGPGDADHWRRILALRPQVEPSVRRMADELAGGLDDAGGWTDAARLERVERLRQLGNGVVPLEAGYAARTLAHRLAGHAPAAARLVRVAAPGAPLTR